MNWIMANKPPEGDSDYWIGPFIINVFSPSNSEVVLFGYYHKDKWHWAESKKPISEDFKVTHYMGMPNPQSEEPNQEYLWREVYDICMDIYCDKATTDDLLSAYSITRK